MAIIVFLFGSLLGITGAILQLVLGFDGATAFQTYAFCAFAIPIVTLFALTLRSKRSGDPLVS